MSMKRSGHQLKQELMKKQNTGSSQGFSYGNLQKLKQQKLEMQQKLKEKQEAFQKQNQSKQENQQNKDEKSKMEIESQKDQKTNLKEKNEQQQQQQQSNDKKPESKLTAQQQRAILLMQQKKKQEQLMQQQAKPLPKGLLTKQKDEKESSSQSKQKQQTSTKIPEKKADMPSDYKSLMKYAKKKQMAQQKLQKLIKEKKIVINDKKDEEEQLMEIDPSLRNLRENDQGELVDAEGKIVKLEKYDGSTISRKIKARQEKENQLKKYSSIVQGSSKFFFDSNVSMRSNKMREKLKSHSLHFMEKDSETVDQEQLLQQIKDGSIIERNEEDSQKQLENFQAQKKRVTVKVKHHDPIPVIEWWDKPFLFEDSKNYLEKNDPSQQAEENKQEDQKNIFNQKQIFDNPEEHLQVIDKINKIEFNEDLYNKESITNLVEHPAPFQVNKSNAPEPVIPYYLTREERKKIRRQKRLAKELHKQDQIKLGLLDPPKPKAKLANMINIYGQEAFLDPSRIEKEVKEQVQERLEKHIQMNEERKLTAEQKKQKFLKKLKKDSSKETRAAVFRVENLSDGQHRFKIDANAVQMQLNGLCLIGDYINNWSLVVVEGGPKAIKFYKNLMLKRIKWDQPSELTRKQMEEEENQIENEDEQDKEKKKRVSQLFDLSGNTCNLVWEGILKDFNFNKWKVIEMTTEMEGKKALQERGVEYYWDLVANFKPGE
ncbi:hypothetical protein PPERSA_04045 [Pseudocohnilembus persalinus]|uniref:Pre-mRNA processing factor 3 n=1 Tax=Pseudocohnilembus persalinus TaxID=266149 RepID=A0A0V0QL13_PSEPJ|nr:hypothetical protein PPERSA_04045 [Pseudocohnilembus persalinus]|eukprot:KRX02842.1 hypothetical protein PPERSA_04045 [Pseudocohnilembus persalinus]